MEPLTYDQVWCNMHKACLKAKGKSDFSPFNFSQDMGWFQLFTVAIVDSINENIKKEKEHDSKR